MSKVLYTLCLCIILTFGSVSVFAQTASVFQAVYIYNFTRYVIFPPARLTGEYVIGVFGKSDVTPQLEKTAALKKVAGLTLKIVVFDTPASITDCHILFVPLRYNGRVPEIAAALRGKITVIATEGTGMAADKIGGSITIVAETEKKFEINRARVESMNVKISSELLKLANIVQ